jgi:hypothetical protein
MQKTMEPLSDHPLFRALVLMGGALSVGCGGVARNDAPSGVSATSDGGAASGLTAGANSIGGSAIVLGGAATGGATQTGPTNPTPNAGAFYNPTCPYEQWDCGGLFFERGCFYALDSKDDPIAAGCTCNSKRPTSASACSADQQFVCRKAYPPYQEGQPEPPTWDRTLHIECSCVSAPPPNGENCNLTCQKALGEWVSQCTIRNPITCDESGVCTATSADVLRQDGILCGCADIGLK